MKLKATIVLAILWIFTANILCAQTKKIITYNASLPLGNARYFINQFSFRGGSVEIREMLGDELSIGLLAGWHVFNKKEYATYQENTLSVTGVQYKTINAFPVLINVHKYFGSEDSLRVYAGFGAGMQHVNKNMDIGAFNISDRHWHFGIAPEVGVIYPISYNLSLIGSMRLHYAFKKENSSDLTYLSFNAGLMF